MNDMFGAGPCSSACSEAAPVSSRPAAGIAVDALGAIYVTDLNTTRVIRIRDMTGAGWASLVGNPQLDRFARPLGLAVDATGNVYVADSRNNRIVEVNNFPER